jgi:hypothetical protein
MCSHRRITEESSGYSTAIAFAFSMNPHRATALDLALAKVCQNCPACRRARQRQRGFFFWLVKRVEGKVCPFCRAYERLHGRPAHAASAEPPPKR